MIFKDLNKLTKYLYREQTYLYIKKSLLTFTIYFCLQALPIILCLGMFIFTVVVKLPIPIIFILHSLTAIFIVNLFSWPWFYASPLHESFKYSRHKSWNLPVRALKQVSFTLEKVKEREELIEMQIYRLEDIFNSRYTSEDFLKIKSSFETKNIEDIPRGRLNDKLIYIIEDFDKNDITLDFNLATALAKRKATENKGE